MTLAFLMAVTTVTNLGLSSRAGDGVTARNLATSVLNKAVAKLRANPSFKDKDALMATMTGYSEAEACGYVSFDVNNKLGLPYSFNNLDNDSSQPGFDGTTVPAHTAHIIAVGRFRGLEHRLESVVVIPYLPYAVACKDRFLSKGGLMVAGLRDLGPVRNGLELALLGPLEPATALSNASGPAALTFGPADRVNGNAQAVGNVVLNNAKITGETRQGNDPVILPNVNVADYDVKGRPGLEVLKDAILKPKESKLGGFVRRQGDLEVGADLDLDNAVLYVTGNLTVVGGLKGVGALVVGGNCTINGGGKLGTDSFTAVLVNGNLEINAPAKPRAEIRGLVYVGGNFKGSHVDVVGSLVANGANSRIEATNCRLIHAPINSIALGKLGDVTKVGAPLCTFTSVVGDPQFSYDLAYGPIEVDLDPVYRDLSYKSNLPLHYVIPDEVVQDPTKIFNYVREIRVGSQKFSSYKAFRAALTNGPRKGLPFAEIESGGWHLGHLAPLPDYSRATWKSGVIDFPKDQPRLDWIDPKTLMRGDFPVPDFDKRMEMTAKLLAQSQWTNYVVNDRINPQAQTWRMDLSKLLKTEDRVRTLMVRDR